MKTQPTLEELDREDWDLLKQVDRLLPQKFKGVDAAVWMPKAARYSPEVVNAALACIAKAKQ